MKCQYILEVAKCIGGSANLPIQSEEAPSPGATASEMATDILHSVYIMLKLFFILMMSIARRCHSEFILFHFLSRYEELLLGRGLEERTISEA